MAPITRYQGHSEAKWRRCFVGLQLNKNGARSARRMEEAVGLVMIFITSISALWQFEILLTQREWTHQLYHVVSEFIKYIDFSTRNENRFPQKLLIGP